MKTSGDSLLFGATGVVVIATGGLLFLSLRNRPPVDAEREKLAKTVAATPIMTLLGSQNACFAKSTSPVIIEFGDYQCGPCRTAYLTLEGMQKRSPHSLTIVFRHFPLQEIHREAFRAATYAEAARDQGQFAEMHDVLFRGNKLRESDLQNYAKNLNLDLPRLRQSLRSTARKRVNDDLRFADSLNIRSTPTLISVKNGRAQLTSLSQVMETY